MSGEEMYDEELPPPAWRRLSSQWYGLFELRSLPYAVTVTDLQSVYRHEADRGEFRKEIESFFPGDVDTPVEEVLFELAQLVHRTAPRVEQCERERERGNHSDHVLFEDAHFDGDDGDVSEGVRETKTRRTHSEHSATPNEPPDDALRLSFKESRNGVIFCWSFELRREPQPLATARLRELLLSPLIRLARSLRAQRDVLLDEVAARDEEIADCRTVMAKNGLRATRRALMTARFDRERFLSASSSALDGVGAGAVAAAGDRSLELQLSAFVRGGDASKSARRSSVSSTATVASPSRQGARRASAANRADKDGLNTPSTRRGEHC